MSEVNWTELAPTKLDTVIGGSVKLLEVLGNGSYGCLFLGQIVDPLASSQSDKYVAVKTLSKRDLDDHALALQRQELSIHASLTHPNVVRLHQVIEDADTIYMVMELCEGDLFEAIVRDQQLQAAGAGPDDEFIRAAFGQVLDAVEYMHRRGVYHRDIKPENILVHYPDSVEGNPLTFKLADFGLATCDAYSSEFGCGSTSYLAPEHFSDDSYVGSTQLYSSSASDVWSLGILLLALIFGRNPWQEASATDPVFAQYRRNQNVLRQLFPVSDDCLAFLRLALAVDPACRPSVYELRKAFNCITCFVTPPALLATVSDNSAPVDIPAPAPATAQMAESGHMTAKHTRNSYDSGVFMSSWSDLEDDDDVFQGDPFGNPVVTVPEDHYMYLDKGMEEPVTFGAPHEDHDDAMFVHAEERDSWWM